MSSRGTLEGTNTIWEKNGHRDRREEKLAGPEILGIKEGWLRRSRAGKSDAFP